MTLYIDATLIEVYSVSNLTDQTTILPPNVGLIRVKSFLPNRFINNHYFIQVILCNNWSVLVHSWGRAATEQILQTKEAFISKY